MNGFSRANLMHLRAFADAPDPNVRSHVLESVDNMMRRALATLALVSACSRPRGPGRDGPDDPRTSSAPDEVLFEASFTSTPCSGPCATSGTQLKPDGHVSFLAMGAVVGTAQRSPARMATLRLRLEEGFRSTPVGLPAPEPNDLHGTCVLHRDGVTRTLGSTRLCEALEREVRAPE